MTAYPELKQLLRTLVEAAGGTLEPVLCILDRPYEEQLANDYGDRIEHVQQAALSGFIHCAACGITFTDESQIENCYGASLETAYPGVSRTFMALARTYWTFKVVLLDGSADSLMCVKILWAIDVAFAGLFFPTPGPFSPPKQLREQTMRDFIRAAGADFDEDDYIRNNYYLR